MKKRNVLIIAFLIAATMITSCKKSSVAPSGQTPALTFSIKSDNLTSNGITFTSAVANINKFAVEAKKNGVQTEISTKNASNVDLLALSNVITSATIDPGTYSEVEVKIVLKKSSGTDIPITLKGNYTNSSNTVIPFEVDLNDDIEIKAEASNVVVTSNADYSSFVHMHFNKLINNITSAELDNAIKIGNAIVISNASNTALYNKILINLTTSSDSEFIGATRPTGNGNSGGY